MVLLLLNILVFGLNVQNRQSSLTSKQEYNGIIFKEKSRIFIAELLSYNEGYFS